MTAKLAHRPALASLQLLWDTMVDIRMISPTDSVAKDCRTIVSNFITIYTNLIDITSSCRRSRMLVSSSSLSRRRWWVAIDFSSFPALTSRTALPNLSIPSHTSSRRFGVRPREHPAVSAICPVPDFLRYIVQQFCISQQEHRDANPERNHSSDGPVPGRCVP